MRINAVTLSIEFCIDAHSNFLEDCIIIIKLQVRFSQFHSSVTFGIIDFAHHESGLLIFRLVVCEQFKWYVQSVFLNIS